MTPNKVKEILDDWAIGFTKSFKHNYYSLNGPEYIVILRKEDNLFEVNPDRSTIVIGPFNKETFEKLLGSNTLTIIEDYKWEVSYKNFKSQGCDCGAWRTRDPDCHSYWCKKNEK